MFGLSVYCTLIISPLIYIHGSTALESVSFLKIWSLGTFNTRNIGLGLSKRLPCHWEYWITTLVPPRFFLARIIPFRMPKETPYRWKIRHRPRDFPQSFPNQMLVSSLLAHLGRYLACEWHLLGLWYLCTFVLVSSPFSFAERCLARKRHLLGLQYLHTFAACILTSSTAREIPYLWETLVLSRVSP